MVTIGLGTADGRDEFVGIPFRSLATVADVSDLDGTIVFVTDFPIVATKSPAYQILHTPPPLRDLDRASKVRTTRDRGLIATSQFAAKLWSAFLDVDVATIQVVYPFAEPCFGSQQRQAASGQEIRILYAGRLSPEKGIYTFLAMLHNDLVDRDARLTFTATKAGADKPQGRIITRLLEAHPGIRLVPAQRTPARMAALMAEHDIVVLPSNSQYWHETFGIVSIEAQHAGCRVVASDDGGLPETDCGALTLVVPDDAEALALGIREAITRGALPGPGRETAATKFTVRQSVDQLLAVLARPHPLTPARIVQELELIALLPSPEEPLSRPRTVATA